MKIELFRDSGETQRIFQRKYEMLHTITLFAHYNIQKKLRGGAQVWQESGKGR